MAVFSAVREAQTSTGYLVGAAACAAAFAPFYGPIAGVPASFLSLVFVPISFLSLIASGIQTPPRIVWLSIVPTIVIFVLAASQATPEQFMFLADTSMWSHRYDDYQAAKLLMISVALIPQIAAIVFVVLTKDPSRALTGAIIALSALALAAAANILINQGAQLFRTDEATAAESLLSAGYSRVSYGALLTIGAIASLRFRWGWVLAGVLLFSVALISRRADTFVLVLCLGALAMYLTLRGRGRDGLKPIGALLLGSVLFIGLHNDQNVAYFVSLVVDSDPRTQMISESLSAIDSGEYSSPAPGQPSAVAEPAEVVIEKEAHNILLGAGLGTYKDVTGSEYFYPHNIILESYIELGILAAILMASISVVPLALLGYLALRGQIGQTPLLIGACLAQLTAISLKAGELGFLGKLSFLSTLTLLAIWVEWRERGSSATS